jgi:predicted dehydrogenase
VVVSDVVAEAAYSVAAQVNAEVTSDWRAVVQRPDVQAVAVATPNKFLAEVAIAALKAGKHVLVEKPMGRSLEEALRMRDVAAQSGRVLKVGFNHRYHPAIAEAHRRAAAGAIGVPFNARCRYGHGSRPGCEKEWRANRELAGGGELTDQGVHALDLMNWFFGSLPVSAFAWLQTAVWPLGELEDNAFGLLRYASGAVASLHVSMTQWKNLFSLELTGTGGALVVEGLGRSYGVETLSVVHRNPEGGVPEVETVRYDGEDDSWCAEWRDFLGGVQGRAMLGTADEGVAAMRVLDMLYRSAESGAPVTQ